VLRSPPRRGNPGIGYVPQHQSLDRDLPLRGRDLVGLGLDGHRWGIGRVSAADRRTVEIVLAAVEATAYADAPIGRLSGGEQQRLRIAQALVGDPQLLLCDEPLASLDLHHQQEITELIAGWHERSSRTVLFVTHDVNPILHLVDRVLFVVNGRWAVGTPDEVLTSDRLSDLYGAHVDVLRVHGRVLVVGDTTGSGFDLEQPHHLPAIDDDAGHEPTRSRG
jgi:zinc/manganese transport system ATP-binding protein